MEPEICLALAPLSFLYPGKHGFPSLAQVGCSLSQAAICVTLLFPEHGGMFLRSSGKEGASLGLWPPCSMAVAGSEQTACWRPGPPHGRQPAWEDPSRFRFDTLPAGRLVKGVALPELRLLVPHPGALFQNKNLDWFPRMRAMSLVSGEGEGEQNEIRILQEKLGSTMKLVSHLTAQLNELKEQVCPQYMWGRGHRCHREPWFRLRLAYRWSFLQLDLLTEDDPGGWG